MKWSWILLDFCLHLIRCHVTLCLILIIWCSLFISLYTLNNLWSSRIKPIWWWYIFKKCVADFSFQAFYRGYFISIHPGYSFPFVISLPNLNIKVTVTSRNEFFLFCDCLTDSCQTHLCVQLPYTVSFNWVKQSSLLSTSQPVTLASWLLWTL